MDKETVQCKNMLVNCAKDLVSQIISILSILQILKGVVSIRQLLQSAADDIQIDKMIKPITVNYFTDQERIIYLVLDYELKAIPVVNNEIH